MLLLLGSLLFSFFYASHSLFVEDLRVDNQRVPMGVTAPRFSWNLVDPTYKRGQHQTAYQLVVRDEMHSVVWDTGTVSSAESNLIPYGGKALAVSSRYTWNVRVADDMGNFFSSANATFVTGLWGNGVWKGKWITGGNDANQLRKEFTITGVVGSAFAHVSGLGYFELFVNGRKVGDHSLDVGWTDYAKRGYYVTLDVTEHLIPNSRNAIAIVLGNGWFSCLGQQPGCTQAPPQLLFQLQLSTSSTPIVSDLTWKVSPGPITYNSLYNGETYDARLETPGWDKKGFNDTKWAFAQASGFAPAIVSAQNFPPIRRLTERQPITISEPVEGQYVLDFGQNMAGLLKIKIRNCPSGNVVTLRHGELLNHPPYAPANGQIYTGNLRSAKATDTYTCKGDPSGVEVYTPTFTQHGFRFSQIAGLTEAPTEDDVVAVELHSDVLETGTVTTSYPLINKIQHNTIWGQKSNLMSLPTDCPQRDERRGWMGDAALTAEEATYNFDMHALYYHWINIIRDDQAADGSVNNYVPSLGDHSDGAPNWETAYPTIIWVLHRYGGDVQVVKDHWTSLEAYINFFDNAYKKTGLKNFFTGFGDWVPPPPQPMADGHLVAAFSYLRDLTLFAELSAVVGRDDIRQDVERRLGDLRSEFNAAFFDSTKKVYGSGLQTEIAMGLWLDAPTAADKAVVLQNLVTDIMTTHNVHPTTGILGWKFMLETLTNNLRSDVALAINLQTTYPSIGFMIEGEGNPEPATTIWELWDSYVEGPGMNSRNHIMFGSVGSWLYRAFLGIVPSAATSSVGAGYRNFQVGPDPSIVGASCTNNACLQNSASGRTRSPYGDVQTSWSIVTGSTCGEGAEATTVHLSCSGTIKGFVFASYGTPVGSCASGWKKGSCDSAKALAIVEKACVGKGSCDIPVSNDYFGGDPCYGTAKTFAATVACSQDTPDAHLDVSVTVPVGTTASVNVPIVPQMGQTQSNVVIREGGQVVWTGGKYVGGVSGVVGAELKADGSAVVVNVVSGKYAFEAIA